MSTLAKKYKDFDRCVIIGNAPSINDIDLIDLKTKAFTIGCNRCLDKFKPHAMLFVDRAPYWQQLGAMRPYIYNHNGILILSDTIWNNKVNCRGEPVAPKFCEPFEEISVTTDGKERIPTFKFSDVFVSGPSIALILIQLAASVGFKKIGMIGIDLVYKNNTHFWGNGKKYGATPIEGHSLKRVLNILSIINKRAKSSNINIYNLSNVDGPINNIFNKMQLGEFIK